MTTQPAPAPLGPTSSLFHGTLDTHVPSILRAVQRRFGRPTTDFGRGFYTTTVERQARSWARQLSLRANARGGNAQPAVIRFDVDRNNLAGLDALAFVRGTHDADDFWRLVTRCRSQGGSHGRAVKNGWYDVVIGPVAAIWRQRMAIYDADQISFHTDPGMMLLNHSNPRQIS